MQCDLRNSRENIPIADKLLCLDYFIVFFHFSARYPAMRRRVVKVTTRPILKLSGLYLKSTKRVSALILTSRNVLGFSWTLTSSFPLRYAFQPGLQTSESTSRLVLWLDVSTRIRLGGVNNNQCFPY